MHKAVWSFYEYRSVFVVVYLRGKYLRYVLLLYMYPLVEFSSFFSPTEQYPATEREQ